MHQKIINYFLMESERYKIKVINHSKIEGHTEYIISIEKNGTSFTFHERYSNLKSLNDLLKKASNSNALPKFPPKKFFGGEDENFIKKRQQELNVYFEAISKNPELSNLPPLIKFIEEKKESCGQSNNKNVTKSSKIESAAQPKKEVEKTPEKEIIKNEIIENKKSEKASKDDVDYTKLVNEYTSKFYDVNNYYDKDMTSDNDGFVKFFKNNKLDTNSNSIKLESGDENNFNFISENDGMIESIEMNIKNKLNKVSDLYKSFDDLYDTKGIIVAV